MHFGSETGETGAASALLDGRLVSADVLLAAKVDRHDVTTVESLDVGRGELHRFTRAFPFTRCLLHPNASEGAHAERRQYSRTAQQTG